MIITDMVMEMRQELGLSQREFGELMGVSKMTVSLWERGVCLPRKKYIPKLIEIEREAQQLYEV